MAPRTRFDEQATDFDERAGVGDRAATAIARAVLALAGEGPIVEIGPGTGEIGAHLVTAPYLGIDSSRAMLDAFAARPAPGAPVHRLLVQADAARPWPVRDHAAAAVFSSRAAHLLDPGHVVAEVFRVARPGGCFLIGRVERDPDGLRSRLRERRRALLADHGLDPRDGGRGGRRLLDGLAARGATPLARRQVAQWTVETDPDRILAQWDGAARAGGRPVPAAVHAAVMGALRAWAPAQPTVETESYTLDGVRLP